MFKPKDVHQDYVEGYMDGYNLDCPEPNDNRSERYRHSFAIGRAEKMKSTMPYSSYDACMAAIERIEKLEAEWIKS